MEKKRKREEEPTSPSEHLAKRQKQSSDFSSSYGWEKLHQDLEKGKVIGAYGSNHAPYHALSSVRTGKNLKEFHSKRSKDEFIQEELDRHLKQPSVRARWHEIVTMDPLGIWANPPTIAATTAHMEIPEIKDKLVRDGRVVNDEGCINVIKCAIDYAWNLPGMAERLKMDEGKMREALFEYTQNPKMLDKSLRAYYPAVGGVTVYFIGDVDKLHDKKTEVAVRVHDACCGSDVFGTDICTCRPYLIYAIQAATECAQRGGVGLIIYYQKEGRSLGEVTKFRVYNARKRQEGGDRPDMYFYQTESIAGIRDARFQEMMPDVLLWLGVNRIDLLLSMSADKYDAITGAGIEVIQRVALPDKYVPKNATVEITAKIASGYQTNASSAIDMVAGLRQLETIRQKCGQIFALAEKKKSNHFNLHMDKLDACVDYVIKVTKSNYPDLKIPMHSRWRQFDQKALTSLVNSWPVGPIEKARRKVDLITISVFLDGGAGNTWKYVDDQSQVHVRSEGLARATMDMFEDGTLSSDVALPHRVNSHALINLTPKHMVTHFQATAENPLLGVDARCEMMKRLGTSLKEHPDFFGHEVHRPGNVVDYVLKHCTEGKGDVSMSNGDSKATKGEAKSEKKQSKAKGKGKSKGKGKDAKADDDGDMDTSGDNTESSSSSSSNSFPSDDITPKHCSIKVLWNAIIEGYENIWPEHLAGVKRGDMWVYSSLKKQGQAASDVVPFHKLPQWLMYSLLEPFAEIGVTFDDMHLLTGLAEYRNGGLFVDMGVISPIDKDSKEKGYDVGSEFVVEWRALTIILLDKVAERMREKLKMTAEELPLSKVLQGGTWQAGRRIAEKRPNRAPPIHIRSDGTVF